MSFRVAHKGKVTLGANTVVGMGVWNLTGIIADQLETTELGDDWKTYTFGLKDGGEVTFNGLYDPDDTNGQNTLRLANTNMTDITNIRLYIDATSYYQPDQTTVSSHVNVSAYDVGFDKSQMGTTSFTLKVSGRLVLV